MLRLIYADQGPKEDTLGAVRAARHWATARAAEGLGQLRGYLADGGPFPDRLHISVLFARFYGDLFELIVRWADLAEEHIGQWPRTDGLGLTGPTRELLEELVTRMEALTAAEPAGSDASNETGRGGAAHDPCGTAPRLPYGERIVVRGHSGPLTRGPRGAER